MLHLSFQDITAPAYKGLMPARIKKLLKDKQILFESVQIAKDGHRIPIEVSSVLFHMDDGPAIMSVARDLTRRKRTEKALEESRDRFRKIVEQAPIAMAIVGLDGTIEFINHKAVKVFGYLHKEIPTMDRWWVQAYPDEAYRTEIVADWTGRIRRALTDGSEIAGNEYRVTCKDGSIKTMFISGVPVSDKIFVMFDDITERKQAENALRESEERFSKAFKTSPYAYMIATVEDGSIIEVNDAFTTLSGFTREEAMAGSTLSLKLWVNVEDRRLMVDTLRDGRAVVGLETKLLGKNGTIRTVLLSAQEIRLGHRSCILSIVEDITERKKTESLLLNSQKLDALGVLAGGIAHDFNNLLTGIFGYIDLARSVSKETKTVNYLESTIATMNRAKALTLQLLTFAKGGSPVQKITSLIPFIQETAQFALSGSNISCKFFLAENLWPCNIDKNQIAQMIDNIVINAQQAMPNGGTIEISAANISLGEKDNPQLSKGDYVKVSVKDFGIGIPKDILPRIFDPFYTTKLKGHGLGLATCFSIINRHGGCIEVESEPAMGSTFHFYLPASSEAVPSNVSTTGMHRGSGTIMVVDDEEVVRDSIRQMLELLGYDVVCKNDGRAAIDYFINETTAKRQFAAMIFDLTIAGGMGGMESIAEIRTLNKDIPVFVASGYSDSSVMRNPDEWGFTASISKPFTIAELSEMLNQHLKI
jgi:PAS domain S-box-containing protein